MTKNDFPTLLLTDWQSTRDTIQLYAKLIGKIRATLTPKQIHWWHITLHTTATGLTTTPIPAGPITFDIRLDFINHQLLITTSRGEQWQKTLRGQPVTTLCTETLAVLANLGISPEINCSSFGDTMPPTYDIAAVERYWQALSQIDVVFKQVKGELRGTTSPVHLFPHHFDLAFLWLSGRLVPGVDPEDEENADEQMNFGFSTGDEGIANPYFYITAYPSPKGFLETPLPEGATWHRESFQGAVMMYETLVELDNPQEKLYDFLKTVQQAGATLMK